MINISLITLGCAKNQVDSEAVLAMFDKTYFNIVTSLNDSDVIIVNTCGFIEDAKKEAIDTILNVITYNKKVVVIGCLVERYKEELIKEIPEVDLFIDIKSYYKMNELILTLFENKVKINEFDINNRIISTPKYSAYLKIGEGCDNFCGFCAIPHIRGRYHSFKLEDLIKKAHELASNGVKELVVISQDTTKYGLDFKNQDITLVTLLKELEKIEGIEFIRVLYLYPDEISDELLEFIKNSKKMTHYLDIPIQHSENHILKSMNRKDSKKDLINLYKKIKKMIPDCILRTTLIVGYPNETNKDILNLMEFINKIQFNHLGVFTYSKEEGTKGYYLKHQVRESTKLKRKDMIMKLQSKISYSLNKSLISKTFKGIIIGKENNNYLVRCGYNAPDEIDGKIYLKTNKIHELGDIVNIKITGAMVYDLLSEEISL